MLRHVRPVAGPTCSCTSVTNRSTSGVVTSGSRSAPRAGKTCAFSCREYVSTVPGDRCPSLANRSNRSNHTAAQPRSIRAPETPGPRLARSARGRCFAKAKRAVHSVLASRSTIRRTRASEFRNHARARQSAPPGDLETDTSPHSPGLSRRRGIAKPPAESSGPARRTRPTREIEGACQAESLADHILASASHRSSELEHSEMRQHPLSSTTGHAESTSPASSTCSGVTDSADPSVIALRQPSAFGVDSRPSELSRGVQEPHLPASRQLSASIRA